MKIKNKMKLLKNQNLKLKRKEIYLKSIENIKFKLIRCLNNLMMRLLKQKLIVMKLINLKIKMWFNHKELKIYKVNLIQKRKEIYLKSIENLKLGNNNKKNNLKKKF